MIVYYDKRTNKILGTQDMTFIDRKHTMHWSDIDDKYIGKRFIGGKGKIIKHKKKGKILKIKKDNLWNVMREVEDCSKKLNLLGYKIKKRGKRNKKNIDRKHKEIYYD